MNDKIINRNDLQFFLQEDAKRNGYGKNYVRYLLALIHGKENAYILKYLRILRHCEYHTNNQGIFHNVLAFFYQTRLNHLGLKLSIKIPLNCCGYGLRIMHLSGGGVLINAERVGHYCGFNSGVLIGNVNDPDARPKIGNYCAFGPGAKAFGRINIGDNVFVAPNAVVTKDLPPNYVVGGVPAKKIKENQINDNLVYKNFKI